MSAVAEGDLRVVNPATLELVATVPATPPEGVQELVAEARLGQERWGETPLAGRRTLLLDAAAVLLDSMDEIAETVVAETAKPLVEAFTTELLIAAESLVWLAREAPRVLAPERVRFRRVHLLHKRAQLVYEPRGVIALITPWNFPLGIPFTQAATAIAAGNAVVLKPSELTPLSGEWVARVFERAGAPAGLIRVAQGDGRIGEALVHARGIGKVVFTGSAEVGRLVAAAAGERLVPVTLELGGKDAMVVLDDADLRRAVEGALWGAFLNAGQVCSSVERVYVEEPLYEPFVTELSRRAGELRLVDDIGPLISEEQRAKVEGLIDDAVARGARAETGGRRPEREGWFYEPTVLVDVPGDARIEREEIFGPAVTVAKVANEDQAVRAANDSPFGLGASVWTRDGSRAERVGRRLEAGSVWHNDHSYSYGAFGASWGGRKDSGFGRTHSKHGLYDVSNVKFVDRDSGRIPVAWWFPYDERAAEAFRAATAVVYGRDKLRSAWRHRRGLAELGRRYLQ